VKHNTFLLIKERVYEIENYRSDNLEFEFGGQCVSRPESFDFRVLDFGAHKPG
jgi:hypothetical protein